MSHQGRISLWDLVGGGGPVTCVAADPVAGLFVPGSMCFSPDGRFLAGVGRECYLWPTARAAGAGTGPGRRPVWSGRTYNAQESLAFSPTGGLLAAAEMGDFRGDERVGVGGGATVFEPPPANASTDPAEPICRVSDHDRLVVQVAFVSHHPWLVTAGDDGTLLVWDLRRALAPEQSADRSDAQLWDDLAGDDAAAAYRAGGLLADRGQLLARSAAIPPVPPVVDFGPAVADLSSPNRGRRDAAHKRLESAGPAAADAVRRAWDRHPGGEAEARLADLVRMADGSPPAAAAGDDGVARRRRRLVQLLDWSDDPAARGAASRLRGGAAATRP